MSFEDNIADNKSDPDSKKGPLKKDEEKIDNLMASESDIDRIKKVAKEMGLNTIGNIERKIGISVNFRTMTKTQATRVYTELLAKQVAKR